MLEQAMTLLCFLIVLGTAALPALAAPDLSIDIEAAPPPPLPEGVPPPRPGYVWAPGFWGWYGDRHVWVDGRWMRECPGYRWQRECWEKSEHDYHFTPGRWVRHDPPQHP